MVKAPAFSSRASGGSSFGDKFKPWRKGKSTKSKKGGSLKHQLRGLERLLTKTKDDDAERREQLTKSIQDLKQQIANKELVEKERQNAKKSHGARFLDRQRLTRQWQLFEKQQRQSSASTSTSNKELFRLGWDMLYVAHFPHAKMSYQSLFASNKKRAQPRGRALAKLVSARQAICKVLHDGETKFAKVAWVPDTVYDEMEIPKDWTTKLEKETYGYDERESTNEKGVGVSDDRFLPTSENTTAQSKVLEAAEAIEAELDRLEQEEDNNNDNDIDLDNAAQSTTRNEQQKGGEKSASPPSSDDDDEDSSRASPQEQPAKSEGGLTKRKRSGSDASSSSSSYGSVSDSSQEADPLQQQRKVPTKAVSQSRPKQKIEKDDDGESSWSSSSSSSDDDSSDDEEASTPKLKPQNKTEESSSDDSSTSSSSSSSHDKDDTATRDAKRQKAKQEEEEEEEEPMVQDDGFLIPADDSTNHKKAFANAKQHIPERLTGDKSQGWATQRQKPGQFKRRQQNGRRGF